MNFDRNEIRRRMGLPSLAPPVRHIGRTSQFSAIGTAPPAARFAAADVAAAPLDESQLEALLRRLRTLQLADLGAFPVTFVAELYRVLVADAADNALSRRMGLPSQAPRVRHMGRTSQFSAIGTEAPTTRKSTTAALAAALDFSQSQALLRALRGLVLPNLRALPGALAAELYRALVKDGSAAPAAPARTFARRAQ